MEDFQFYVPTKIVFGEGKRKEVGVEASKLGSKALFVVGPHIKKTGLADDIIKNLQSSKIKVVIFSESKANPTSDIVEKAVAQAQSNGCDFIIGMGGGSPMDLAKITAALVNYKGDIWQYKKETIYTHIKLPLILIPTTSGTGSEVNPYAVITDEKSKTKGGIGNPSMFPNVAIVDPELTYDISQRLTAITGVDALIHSIECLISRLAIPVSDLFAMESLRLNVENLLSAFSDGRNKEARKNMSLSSMYAGISNACTGCAAAHIMSYPLTKYFNIEHGIGVGLMMPVVMKFMFDTNVERFAKISELMGNKEENRTLEQRAKESGNLLKNYLAKVNFPKGLSEFGVKEKDLKMLAIEIVEHPAMFKNLKQMKLEDCIQVFREAL